MSNSYGPMDYSLPGSSVHGIFQAKIPEWAAISLSRGSSWPRDRTWVSCIAGRFFTNLATNSVQFSSVAQLCPTLWDPMDCSTPVFPVHHQLPELAQTHVHWVGDAIQPSHPLLPPSPPALNLSQHQGLFQWVGSSHQVAKVLELQLQRQSFQWIFRIFQWIFPLGLTGWISLQSKGPSRVQHQSSKHQFFGAQPSL